MDKRYNPSALMSAFNKVKHQGNRSGLWDGPRADRAFGYLMKPDGTAVEKWAEYATTTESCLCPDSQYRQQICKHSIALMIDFKHDELMADFLQIA